MMYLPESFRETRPAEIKRILEDFPLATLITWSHTGLDATHLAFLIDSKSDRIHRLRGHIAKKNPLHRTIRNGTDVLVVYRAEDSYISPNWYPAKEQTQQAVPTWNYQAIHIYGQICFTENPTFIRRVVGELTNKHELNIGESPPWKLGNARSPFIQQMISSVVGIEINVGKIEAKSKLSQNRTEVDFDGVRINLRRLHKTNIACAMDALKQDLEFETTIL